MHERTHRTWLPSGWQAAFLLFGTTWLSAPFLNAVLSRRLTLISQYELPVEPYSWLFRMGDLLAALLLITVMYLLLRRTKADKTQQRIYFALFVVGVSMLLDPLFTTSCKLSGRFCVEFFSTNFLIHTTETLLTALGIFVLSTYDAFKKRTLPSTFFLVFELLYLLLYFTDWAVTYRFATLSQVVYQVLSLIWLAWYVGSLLQRHVAADPVLQPRTARRVRSAFAIWAYLNGVLAILLGLVHIRLFGFLREIYFAGNTAWLAQHGVIVGVVMLYLSRHLGRGEHRARILFLILLFVEALKYAAVTPDLDLLALYGITFVLLFSLRPFFKRGSVAPDWHLRLQEIAFVFSGVAVVAGIVAFMVSRSPRLYRITHNALNHFSDFVLYSGHSPRHLLRSSLLDHTIAVLLLALLAFVLWSLFRPAKTAKQRCSQRERQEAQALLEKYAVSSEDFFKIWPHDKYYFWSADRQAFVAYTIVDSLVFALADPVAANDVVKKALLKDFVDYWHGRAYTTCFLLIYERSVDLYRAVGLTPTQIGSSAIIDVHEFVTEIANDKWWRWQRNRSTKAGYTYHHSLPPHAKELISQCRSVSNSWLQRPGHRERGFALGTFNEAYLQQCTLHYLTDATGAVIAFTNQVPAFPHLRQATVDMMRYLPDKNNAMPFLLANVIQSLAEEQTFSHFDLGFVPLAKMDNMLVSVAKTLASSQVSAAGLEQFKGKFKPAWQKNYLAYDGDLADLATLALRVEDALKPR